MSEWVQTIRAKISEWSVIGIVACAVGVLLWSLLPQVPVFSTDGETNESCNADSVFCHLMPRDDTAASSLAVLQPPEIAQPEWLKEEEKKENITVTYSIETRGNVITSEAQFAQMVAETYADERGWAQLGATFERVESGGEYILVLSEASQVPSFSPGCDAEYSCRAGEYVIINEDRWLNATDPWNESGGSLRDYRHMVVNHETGHWLGHGHYQCPGPGQPAPVMQQQSIDLQGCEFNPWPLDFELTSSQLGV